MGKKYKTRTAPRPSGLGTTDAIHKVLMQIYWAKKAGKKYVLADLFTEEHLHHLNKDLVERACSWESAPTREEAEALRTADLDHQAENWDSKKKVEQVDYVPDDLPVEAPLVVFPEDPVAKQCKECNDFGILTWNGHRYRLVPID